MKNFYRTFIALNIKPEKHLLDLLLVLKSNLVRDKISWVNPEHFHLTLHFLGETDLPQINCVKDILNNISSNTPCFEIDIKGLGAFYRNNDAFVVWTGIKHCNELLLLHRKLNNALKNHNFKTESRPFSPHLTLGRIRSLYNTDILKKLITSNTETELQKCMINNIYFYESILDQRGAVYKIIDTYPLK